MHPEHTPSEIIAIVGAAIGSSYVLDATNQLLADVDGLLDINGVEVDGDGDVWMWTGTLTDAATGETVAHWSVPDHWPTVDIFWS